MNNKFDELTKNMALSVTRRGALRKLGAGLAGIGIGALRSAEQSTWCEAAGSGVGPGPMPEECRLSGLGP